MSGVTSLWQVAQGVSLSWALSDGCPFDIVVFTLFFAPAVQAVKAANIKKIIKYLSLNLLTLSPPKKEKASNCWLAFLFTP